MRLDELEKKLIRAAKLRHSKATLGQLGAILDERARAAEECLEMGDKAGVVEACGELVLISALVLHRCGFSLADTLLDWIGAGSDGKDGAA